MKRVVAVLVAVAAVSLLWSVAEAAKEKAVYGTVVSADADSGKIEMKTPGRRGKQITIATDAATKISLADKPMKLSDLKAGMVLRVTPREGTATEIKVFLPKSMAASQPSSQPTSQAETMPASSPASQPATTPAS